METIIVILFIGVMVFLSFIKTKLSDKWQLIVACIAGLVLLRVSSETQNLKLWISAKVVRLVTKNNNPIQECEVSLNLAFILFRPYPCFA